MSEICDFYFWRLQFEVPFRHFDKMKAFRQICLQATFSWTRQDRFFCLRPCFFTPEQKYGLKWRAIMHLPLPQCVRNSSMFSAFYFHSSFCYLLMAKQAVLTRNCTLFDTKFTREVFKLHMSRLQIRHVKFWKPSRRVSKTDVKSALFRHFSACAISDTLIAYHTFCLTLLCLKRSIYSLTSQNIL